MWQLFLRTLKASSATANHLNAPSMSSVCLQRQERTKLTIFAISTLKSLPFTELAAANVPPAGAGLKS